MTYQDIALSFDGDLVFGDYDLAVVKDGDYLKQQAVNRIKSIRVDWRYDHIGADMEELIGQVNSFDTAKGGQDKIMAALMFDDLFSPADIYIRPVPLDKSVLIYFIFINSLYWEEPYLLIAEVDLQGEVTVRGNLDASYR